MSSMPHIGVRLKDTLPPPLPSPFLSNSCFHTFPGDEEDPDAPEASDSNSNATDALSLQNLQGATAVLYWNAPLVQFQNAPNITINSSGGSIESGIVTVTGATRVYLAAALYPLYSSMSGLRLVSRGFIGGWSLLAPFAVLLHHSRILFFISPPERDAARLTWQSPARLCCESCQWWQADGALVRRQNHLRWL